MKPGLTFIAALFSFTAHAASSANPAVAFANHVALVQRYASAPLTKVADAKSQAESLLREAGHLRKDPHYGDAIYYANLVLGRIQLQNGDVKSALHFLTLAGNTPGSPHLNSAGPSTTFASELLAKKQIPPVLDYFEHVQKFWRTPQARKTLIKWKATILRGHNPDFRGYP